MELTTLQNNLHKLQESKTWKYINNYLEEHKANLLEQACPKTMETNHFIMGQLKTLDVMKSLPSIVANEIANQLKIEEDRQTQEKFNV